VQNRLNLTNGNWHDMLTECGLHETGFIPYRPLRAWDDPAYQHVLTAAASGTAQTPARSPSPGCSQSLPSHCPSPEPQHPRTSKTISQRPRSNSNKTRYTRSPRRHRARRSGPLKPPEHQHPPIDRCRYRASQGRTRTSVIDSVGCQPAVQAARRSPRSVAVDEIQQEVGLPPVTADIVCQAVSSADYRK
jgi:hypothetical protein